VGGAVTGIGATQHGLESYCTAGRFQWQFIQPVYVGSNQMQERPPAGMPMGTSHDITYYRRQLEEISPDGKLPPYMYAVSQIAHEMGNRCAVFVSAKVGGETIELGPVHWAFGLQAPFAFSYRRSREACIMGGGIWQDNFDGTLYLHSMTTIMLPAMGWSYLDLYLTGLISAAEAPDFFILRNPVLAGKDTNGHPIFKADRIKVTIAKPFNTGMVTVVQHGRKPSCELIERTEGIRKQWIEYFSITTEHRAVMTALPHWDGRASHIDLAQSGGYGFEATVRCCAFSTRTCERPAKPLGHLRSPFGTASAQNHSTRLITDELTDCNTDILKD